MRIIWTVFIVCLCFLSKDKSARDPKYGTGEKCPPAGHQKEKNRKIFGKMKDILFLCIGFLYNMDMILVHVLFSKDFCQKSIEAVK